MNEQKRAVDERERFKREHKHLDCSDSLDAWNGPTFKHSHVQAMWEGWSKRAALDSSAVAGEPECAHKFVGYYEGVELCEKCKATRPAARAELTDEEIHEEVANFMEIDGDSLICFYPSNLLKCIRALLAKGKAS